METGHKLVRGSIRLYTLPYSTPGLLKGVIVIDGNYAYSSHSPTSPMKRLLLAFLIVLAATASSQAQTLQIDPMYAGGSATFEVQNGSPGAFAVICYSINGAGPSNLGNGIILDLSMPIRNLSPFALDAMGNGSLGPFPVPSNAPVGMQVWFQGVQFDMWANPIYSVTNMLPITVQNNPPIAVDDHSSVQKDSVVLIDVLANDSDPDGDAIGIVSVSAPPNGTVLIISGQIAYTPLAGYVGAESFTYVIEDTFASQAMATVFVSVGGGDTLVSWGNDTNGQVSDTPTTHDFVQVTGGAYHSIALRDDGSLVSWGWDSYGQVTNTPTGNDFTQVAAGYGHCVALKLDGSLVSWGDDTYLQVTNTPTGNDFTQVATGWYHSGALKSDGSLVSWGDDFRFQVSNTPTTNDFVQVTGGGYHSIALRDDGSLVSWGSDFYGEVANTPTGNDFTQVASGYGHGVALRSDGSLASWGYDLQLQVSNTPTGNDFTQVVAGSVHGAALRSDGSLVSWGNDSESQVTDTPTGNNFTHVSSGFWHSIALKF